MQLEDDREDIEDEEDLESGPVDDDEDPDAPDDVEDEGEGEEEEIDYAAEAKKKAEMVDYLKKDIYEERKKRQELESELNDLREREQTATRTQLDADIAKARDRYKQVFEEGSGDDALKAHEDLTELIVRRRQMGEPSENSTQSKKAAPESPPIAAAAMHWIEKNTWFKQGGDLTDKAIEISKELEANGYDPEDPELYAELDKRIKPLRQQNGKRRKPNAAAVHRGGGSDRKGKRTLTSRDTRLMAEFGYNPSNARDREAWRRRNDPLD